MGAVNACAALAEQTRGLENQLQQMSQSGVEGARDVAGRAVEVRARAIRMNAVAPQTIDALADTIEQHGNPAYAADLRLVLPARQVGQALAEFRMDTTSPQLVQSITRAHDAFEGALDRRAEGAQHGATSVDIAFGLGHLFQEGVVPEDQTRAALRSGLLTHEKDQYTELAREMPQAQVNLTRVFNPTELALLAAYVDHLNTENYWGETGRGAVAAPGLTGGQVLHGQIPLSYAARLFTSVDAVGALSSWSGMTWGGAQTRSEQQNSQLLNVSLSVKLAESLALFQHDVALAGGPDVARGGQITENPAPVVQQQPYAAWNVAPQAPTSPYGSLRADSGSPLITIGTPVSGGPVHHGHHRNGG